MNSMSNTLYGFYAILFLALFQNRNMIDRPIRKGLASPF